MADDLLKYLRNHPLTCLDEKYRRLARKAGRTRKRNNASQRRLMQAFEEIDAMAATKAGVRDGHE